MFTGDGILLESFGVALAPGSSATDPLNAKIPTGSSPFGVTMLTRHLSTGWCR